MRKLSRTISHRRALLRNLTTSLFLHESILTTYAKAKEAQSFAEKVITLAKKNNPLARQRVAAKVFVSEWIAMPR